MVKNMLEHGLCQSRVFEKMSFKVMQYTVQERAIVRIKTRLRLDELSEVRVWLYAVQEYHS